MFIRINFISLFIDSLYKRQYRKSQRYEGVYHKHHQGTRRMRTEIPESGYENRSKEVGGKVKSNDASRGTTF